MEAVYLFLVALNDPENLTFSVFLYKDRHRIRLLHVVLPSAEFPWFRCVLELQQRLAYLVVVGVVVVVVIVVVVLLLLFLPSPPPPRPDKTVPVDWA